ncbi:MAG: hypothetical protein MZV64_16480 [Ignavibacteriales bacterium]|nr:hypothetical protein [Ignavibacteriales bacterium]
MTTKATGRVVDAEIMDLFKLVRSNKTGLRADTVFSQTLLKSRSRSLITSVVVLAWQFDTLTFQPQL